MRAARIFIPDRVYLWGSWIEGDVAAGIGSIFLEATTRPSNILGDATRVPGVLTNLSINSLS